MIDSVLWIWIYTLLFAVLHSVLAMNKFKQRMYAMGMAEHRYRLLYSVVGVMTTLVWLWLIYQLPDAPLYRVEGVARYIFYALQFIGLVIVLAALVPIDGAVFLGLKQAEQQTDPFIVRGIYKYIRHPMYAGVMLFLFAKPDMSVNSFHFALAVSLYFIIGSRLEEKRMLAEHPDYAVYQQQVGAFIPKFWKRG